jgi:non-specific serine/threonine protein kinase
MIKKQVLAFNLSYDKLLKLHIPKGIIVENNDDVLGYFVKTANVQTLNSYQIELDEVCNKLLLLSEKLHPNQLHKKYNVKNKKEQSLDILLQDANNKKVIIQYVELYLERFFKTIASTTIPISMGLEKKQLFKKKQLLFSNVVLEPNLSFHKKENVLDYRLSLLKGKKKLVPAQEKFIILLNEPPYVVYKNKIHTLKYINANKIKPFLTKEVIEIPKRNSVVYFNTFIKKVIKKVTIEAEGFDIITFNNCLSCIIRPTKTIFSKVYYLEVFFVYKNHSFSILNKEQKNIQLDYTDLGAFTVFETVRNIEQEQTFIAVLKDIGIHFLDNGLSTFDDKIKDIDIFYNLSQLIEIKEQLKSKSVKIDFQLNQLKINENKSKIAIQYIENKDWFDVKMSIKAGVFEFSFTELVPYLKSGERLYELPDGSHFLIPLEWYSRYKVLVDLGKVNQDEIAIQKNQFTLLEDAGIIATNALDKDIIPYQATRNIKATLRPYQIQGVNWLVNNYQKGFGSCLADDMGLGKTLQTLTYLDFVYSCFASDFITLQAGAFPTDLFSAMKVQDKALKALIVSPSSLTFNWYNETRKFCPHFSCLSYVGTKRLQYKRDIPRTDLVFTSYGILLRDIEFLKNLAFNFIIIDESQQIKNRNSKIFKAINAIQAKHKVSLSGTPIENSLSDLWSQMQFINPNLLGNYPYFEKHFKKPIENEKDKNQINALKSLIDPYLLRRTKSEVAKDLPELTEQVFYTQLATEQKKLYEEEKSKVRNYIIERKLELASSNKKGLKMSVLHELMKLRQLANHPKLLNSKATSGKFEDVSAYLETLLKSKQKTLVFSSFTSHLKIYTDWCIAQGIKYNLLTGKTKVKDREKEVSDFENNEDSLLFFISLKAGGTGLNLTRASYVIILDPWWNPFAELQAIGRAHRIGQTQQVNVVRFIAKKTIEEKIHTLQQNKKALSEHIIESQITEEIFNDIDRILE